MDGNVLNNNFLCFVGNLSIYEIKPRAFVERFQNVTNYLSLIGFVANMPVTFQKNHSHDVVLLCDQTRMLWEHYQNVIVCVTLGITTRRTLIQ